MADDKQRPVAAGQRLFQPSYGFMVDMVGRFVQNQKLRRIDERSRQGHALALAAGQCFHLGAEIVNAQLG